MLTPEGDEDGDGLPNAWELAFGFNPLDPSDRDRDAEFVTREGATRADLLARWEEGWSRLFQALSALTEGDLTRTVTIRAEPHSVIRAIDRQLTHQAYHTGQIVFLAKHLASDHWKNLSVPRGKTREFNAEMFSRSRAK